VALAVSGGRDHGHVRRRRALVVAVLGAGALLAACGSPSGAPVAGSTAVASTTAPTNAGPTGSATSKAPTTTAPTTTSPTTTAPATTSTTLPVAFPVTGTRAGGSLSLLGGIQRVPVVAVPDGAISPPPPPAAPGATSQSPGAVDVAFREFGSGPDLLLVEGEHATLTWWDPQLLSDLAQHYTVTVFDYPGTGFSAPDPAATSVAAVADVTAGLADALGLVAPTILGWGLGGQVALALAERHPGLAGRLVLVDSAAGGPSARRPAALVAAAMASPSFTDAQLAPLMFPPTLTAAITGWLARVAQLPRDDLVASAVRQQAEVQASAWGDAALAEGLPSLSIPSLVVAGSLDEVFPSTNDAVLLAGLRHARDVVFPGAGYASAFQDEPSFVSALETFTG